jgi:hypothetical protein
MKKTNRCGNCRRMQHAAGSDPYVVRELGAPFDDEESIRSIDRVGGLVWLTAPGGKVLHIASRRGLSRRLVAFCGSVFLSAWLAACGGECAKVSPDAGVDANVCTEGETECSDAGKPLLCQHGQWVTPTWPTCEGGLR